MDKIYYKKYLLYDLNQNSNPNLDIYYKKYLLYKAKYNKLKQALKNNKINMIGGFDIINSYVLEIREFITNVNNLISKNKENTNNNSQLIKLTTNFEKYLEKHDIPIGLKFNPYIFDELNNSILLLEKISTYESLNNLYQQRYKIYEINEENYVSIIDWIIKQNNISNVKDVENLFSSLILGVNKNYVIYYMVLLKFLITNKSQLSVLDTYSPILSLYGLKSCLSASNNSDEYLPLILNLIVEYINSFPIKKVLIIKKPSEFESDWKQKLKLLELEKTEIPNILVNKFDTKNKIFQYESGEIKSIDKINWNDLVQILFNLFRIPIPKKSNL